MPSVFAGRRKKRRRIVLRGVRMRWGSHTSLSPAGSSGRARGVACFTFHKGAQTYGMMRRAGFHCDCQGRRPVDSTHFPIPCTAVAVAASALLSVGALGSFSAAKSSPTYMYTM